MSNLCWGIFGVFVLFFICFVIINEVCKTENKNNGINTPSGIVSVFTCSTGVRVGWWIALVMTVGSFLVGIFSWAWELC